MNKMFKSWDYWKPILMLVVGVGGGFIITLSLLIALFVYVSLTTILFSIIGILVLLLFFIWIKRSIMFLNKIGRENYNKERNQIKKNFKNLTGQDLDD